MGNKASGAADDTHEESILLRRGLKSSKHRTADPAKMTMIMQVSDDIGCKKQLPVLYSTYKQTCSWGLGVLKWGALRHLDSMLVDGLRSTLRCTVYYSHESMFSQVPSSNPHVTSPRWSVASGLELSSVLEADCPAKL